MTTAKILIVDDSRMYRAAIESVFHAQPGMAVVGSVFSGQKALEFIRGQAPDLVTLDVEMPGLSGLETLQAIQHINQSRAAGSEIGVLMVSAFTKRGADVTMQALQAGAFDFVTKPSESSPEASIERLRQDLLPRVRLFLSRRAGPLRKPGPAAPGPSFAEPAPRRATSPRPVQVIVVAASTGGPKALASLLPDLAARVTAPIAVVQHMPAQFTCSLAEHLSRHSGISAAEASEGATLLPGSVTIARGGHHLVLRRDATGQLVAGLNEQLPENGCRPSANVLFRSVAAVAGREAIAIVLTGMGNDGTAGLEPLHRAGAYVIAQDEESSVVWGMPGSAVAAGLVDHVCPLSAIGQVVEALVLPQGKR